MPVQAFGQCLLIAPGLVVGRPQIERKNKEGDRFSPLDSISRKSGDIGESGRSRVATMQERGVARVLRVPSLQARRVLERSI